MTPTSSLVDRVGVLGDLYALADIAYVGGGFHAAGLHSVLEPAAFGAPVHVRPAPREQPRRRPPPRRRRRGERVGCPSLEVALGHWLEEAAARRAAGDAAREVVRAGLGAAERSYELVASLMR